MNTFELGSFNGFSVAATGNLILRRGTPDDAAALGIICYEAFKSISDYHNFPRDFPSVEAATGMMTGMLANPSTYVVVAEIDGRAMGCAGMIEGASVAGVGPVVVDPSAQNASIGRNMVEALLQYAREKGFASVRLVQAAYHNRSMALYTKLGFDTREPLSCLQGPALHLTIPGRQVRPATLNDLETSNKLYRAVHGHDRSEELHDAIVQGSATVVEYAGRITGYTTGIAFFGHAVGESNDDLKALIGTADAFPGPGFLLPTRNGELLRWCFANGLRLVQQMTLMSVGLYSEPRGAFLPSIMY